MSIWLLCALMASFFFPHWTALDIMYVCFIRFLHPIYISVYLILFELIFDFEFNVLCFLLALYFGSELSFLALRSLDLFLPFNLFLLLLFTYSQSTSQFLVMEPSLDWLFLLYTEASVQVIQMLTVVSLTFLWSFFKDI